MAEKFPSVHEMVERLEKSHILPQDPPAVASDVNVKSVRNRDYAYVPPVQYPAEEEQMADSNPMNMWNQQAFQQLLSTLPLQAEAATQQASPPTSGIGTAHNPSPPLQPPPGFLPANQQAETFADTANYAPPLNWSTHPLVPQQLQYSEQISHDVPPLSPSETFVSGYDTVAPTMSSGSLNAPAAAILPTIPQAFSMPIMAQPLQVSSMDNTRLMQLKAEALALGLTDQTAIATYIVGRSNQQNANIPASQPKIKGPALRMDRWDKSESWELFIHRFERMARDLHWDENTRLLQLVSCLSGKALEIYRRTDQENTCTYRELKEELGQAFALTECCTIRVELKGEI